MPLPSSVPGVLYLVGGPPRTGKSTVAIMLMQRRAIPWLPTDVIRNVLGRADPQIAALDRFDRIDDLVQMMRPYLEHTIDVCLGQSRAFLVEGIEIRPADVARYEARHPGTRSCFLGNATITPSSLREVPGDNPWHASSTDIGLERLSASIRRWSLETEAACRHTGHPYVDMGREGFDRGVRRALGILVDDVGSPPET